MEEKPRKTYYGVSLIGASEVKKLFEELEQMPAKSFDLHLIAYMDFLGIDIWFFHMNQLSEISLDTLTF